MVTLQTSSRNRPLLIDSIISPDLGAKNRKLNLLLKKVKSFTRVDSTNNSSPLTPLYSPVVVAPRKQDGCLDQQIATK